jgi:hypothetical protein
MIKKEQLIGAWTLERYTVQDVESGEVSYPMGQNPEGPILYTADGYMSAQLSSGERNLFESGDIFGGSANEYVKAGRSYIAYSPYPASAGCATAAGSRRTRLAPPSRVPVLS